MTIPSFWTRLLQHARSRTALHSYLKPGPRNWLAMTVGRGLLLSYFAHAHDAAIALYIDLGPGTEAETQAASDRFRQSRDRIEATFGDKLCWEPLPGRRACRISYTLPGGGVADEEHWPQIHLAMVDAMIRFEAPIRPLLDGR